MKLEPANEEKQIKAIFELYEKAFPEAEKKSFELILKKFHEGNVDMLYIEEDGAFIGLAIVALYKDLALLDYFAIDADMRGKRNGTRALKLLLQRYENKRFFLEIETPNAPCENKQQRIRRKDFYVRNGMKVTSMAVILSGVEMNVLTDGSALNYEEYHELYVQAYGQKIADEVRLIHE